MTDIQVPTTEDLIALCERAIVNVENWWNRDSASAMLGVGKAWALLKAGVEWRLDQDSNDKTWWIEFEYPGFSAFEEGRSDREHWYTETHYIPTAARLDARLGEDWY